ncbi:hypothetical protein P691DRAFT_544196 [Macrolepiota fuliginosa MF-IS2]|uniref:Uncharacterized protein n=1 Tax=Macrolepiota fuliginosa MF-IS2 TaxID=1400762 RepID=A0A9P5X0G8_9AGAR|nr:hypothetical protein P691DRAFT_544196 [Macrolepiota fuliginosa MF-IS2]
MRDSSSSFSSLAPFNLSHRTNLPNHRDFLMKPIGHRINSEGMPTSKIPRPYHSVVTLTPDEYHNTYDPNCVLGRRQEHPHRWI